MAVVRIEVELDSQGAIVSTRQLTEELKKMPAGTRPAVSEMANLTAEQRRAANAASLLGARIGVQLPREVRKFIAASKMIGPALSAAFSASIYLALAAALYQLISNLDDVIDRVVDWSGAMKKAQDQAEELDKVVREHLKTVQALRKENELIGLQGEERTKKQIRQLGDELAPLLERKSRLQNELLFLRIDAGETRIRGGEREPTDAALNAQKRIQDVNKEVFDLTNNIRDADLRMQGLVATLGTEQLDKATKAHEDLNRALSEDLKYREQRIELGLKLLDQIKAETAATEELRRVTGVSARRAYERAVGADVTPGGIPQTVEEAVRAGERINKQRADEIIKRAEENREKLKKINEQIARDAQEKFERAASVIEGFFDRVFLTARSFGDVMRQLWTQTVAYIVKQIARMVAAWWLGHRQMTQISMGGSPSGSLAGGLAMAGLGGNGGGGGGAFGISAADIPNIAAIINGGGGGGTTGTTGTGGVTGGITGMSGQGRYMMGVGIAGMAGLTLAQAGIGRGSLAMGGVGGFLAGGSIGLALQSAGLLAGTAFGAFLGPIGAGIGAVVGIILATRARGRQKTASAGIHEQYLAAQKQILADFERHRMTYDSAVGGLGSVYQTAVAQLQGLGTPGRRTVTEITPKYQAALRRLEELDRLRGFRMTSMSGLPIPSFQGGGVAPHGGGGGAYLSWLHQGEAVLNRRAAAALGRENIERLNQGQGGGTGGAMTVQMIFPGVTDPRGFPEALKKNQAAVIRIIRNLARDRGVPPPF